jgi:hypothetical protein
MPGRRISATGSVFRGFGVDDDYIRQIKLLNEVSAFKRLIEPAPLPA